MRLRAAYFTPTGLKKQDSQLVKRPSVVSTPDKT